MASTGLTAEGAQLCQRPQGETWGVQSGPLIFALASNRGIRSCVIYPTCRFVAGIGFKQLRGD